VTIDAQKEQKMIVDIWISNGFVVIYDGTKLMRTEHIPPQ
jgi:hypothetical protein